jgi:hypothetical protein
LKEVLTSDYKEKLINKNYSELESLSSPRHAYKNDIEKETMNKLDERKNLHRQYGKLPLKPGFNKRKIGFNEKMDLLSIDIYGEGNNRSKSVDPV